MSNELQKDVAEQLLHRLHNSATPISEHEERYLILEINMKLSKALKDHIEKEKDHSAELIIVCLAVGALLGYWTILILIAMILFEAIRRHSK